MPSKSPSHGDRKGKARIRQRSAQHGPIPWNFGSIGTITRREYDAVHAEQCPCCIEMERRRENRRATAAAVMSRRDDLRREIEVACWCEATTVWVERLAVLEGSTRTCGRIGCHA